MTYKDWDDRERWEDDSKCLVCKADMGKSQALICSATCEDVFSARKADALYDVDKNDCYA